MSKRKNTTRKRKTAQDFTAFEPIWSIDCVDNCEKEVYNLQIAKMLNWYHSNKSKKDCLKYFNNYVDKSSIDPQIKKIIKKVSNDWITPTLGWSCRIVTVHKKQNLDLPNYFENFIQQKVKEIAKICKMQTVLEDHEILIKQHKPNVQENIKKQTENFCADLEDMIFEFESDKCKKPFDVEKWLIGKNVKSQQSLDISQYFLSYAKDLELALNEKDEQLSEAYSHLTRPELKRLISFVKHLIETCESWSKKAKILKASKRKPRARKPRPPIKQIEKLNFLDKTDEYGGLESVPPIRIVGSSELWVFNVKTRVLGVYRCTNNHGFSIKGSTIKNFDIDQSVSKKLRKPEQVLHEVLNLEKRGRNKILHKLSTQENKLNGRINDHTILLRVEK